MSTLTISETSVDRATESHISAEDNLSILHRAATHVHLALGGEPTERPAEDVMDAVRTAISDVRLRRAPKVSTDDMVDCYRPMTHPEEYCHPAWCLAWVDIDDETGRPWHNTGVHRRAVRSMEAKYGVLLQVGIGVADDFELDIDRPFVHLWQTDLDDNPDCVEQLQLTEDEADRLGDFLKNAASELRETKSRIAATTRATAAPS